MRKLGFILATLLVLSNAAFCQQLQIHHIDVGQGDCTLIISPDNKTVVLIDAGDNGCGDRFVRPYLTKIGVSQLKYVIASHYDADHIGGMDEVLISNDLTKIGTVYDRGDKPIPKPTYTMQSYKAAAKEHRKTLKLGQVINIGGGASIKCIAKNGVVLGKKAIPNAARNENNLSVVLLLTYKNFHYYTGGDSGGENISSYVDMETPVSTVIGHVDAMKVDHHGSASSSNNTFLNALHPTVAIIDVGTSKYHHPTQDALNRLSEANCIIYQTEKGNGGTLTTTGSDYVTNGSIKITTDGEKQFNVYYGDDHPNHYAIR
jgi:beta-lactamase superfamily II metal-dependent hydrolase